MFQSQRRMNLMLNTVSYVILIAITAFALFPLLWTLITSFKLESDIVTAHIQYVPREFTLQNYVKIWNRSGFPRLITNSAIVTAMTVVVCLLFGVLAAYSISRYNFRGRTGLLLFYLVIRMFPFVLLLIPLFIMLRSIGLLDSRVGLALAYTTFLLPLCIWLLKGFFDAIPAELEEASRVDGSTRLGALFRIVLPLARPGLIATGVFIAIGAWNEFLFALMLTSSQGARTWPVGLQLMVGEFQLPWGQLSAGGIISIVPIILFFSIVQRSLVRGLTAGGIKG
ncbi:MAG TPA: carbohydrate ABC transporter permease [Thermomicrobiales bacterium]|nr:carbohydrate ABC transporter permease [Thermomicrobiales bacterium]